MKSFIVGRVKRGLTRLATFERRTQLGSWEIEWYKLRRMNGSLGLYICMYVIHVFAELNEKAGETL